MQITHVNYKALIHYRQTYHPAEEIRIHREVTSLKNTRYPFGYRRVYLISKNAQVRIVEELTNYLGLPHPRFLGPKSFETVLPGWKAQLQGLYKYYNELRPHDARTVVDFMLDELGVKRLEELPLADQIKFLRMSERINWIRVSKPLRKMLFERLAREANLPHPRALSITQFKEVKIPEIDTTLIGLHDFYKDKYKGQPGFTIDFMLDDAGVEKLDSLPLANQLKILKAMKVIKWERVPDGTRLKLLELLLARVKNENGMPLPHLRALIDRAMKYTEIPEIGTTLSGLHDLMRRQRPKDYAGSTIDYMLDGLGVEKLEDIDFATQCACIRFLDYVIWDAVPANALLKLLEIVKEKNNLPHLRYLGQHHLEDTFIEEIGTTLWSMERSFQRTRVIGDNRETIDVILDRLGVEKFEEMPFSLQIGWTKKKGGIRWKRVPDPVIAYYLTLLTQGAGVQNPFNIKDADFSQSVGGKASGLLGLYTYLLSQPAAREREGRFVDWITRRYQKDIGTFMNLGITLFSDEDGPLGSIVETGRQIHEKRYEEFELLSPREKFFLLRSAKRGDRGALDHLVFFYQPLISGQAAKAYRILLAKGRYTSMNELVQIGSIIFTRMVSGYKEGKASLEGYLMNYLWRLILREAETLSGAIRKPARFLAKEVSFDQSITADEDGSALKGFVADESSIDSEDALLQKERTKLVHKAIEGSGLSKKEKTIVHKLIFEGLSLREAAVSSGISYEWTRKLFNEAVRKIGSGPFGKALESTYFEED